MPEVGEWFAVRRTHRGFLRADGHCLGAGSRRDDLRPGLRIIGFERRVTVTFMIDDDQVTILRIYYGGRNWEEDFR